MPNQNDNTDTNQQGDQPASLASTPPVPSIYPQTDLPPLPPEISTQVPPVPLNVSPVEPPVMASVQPPEQPFNIPMGSAAPGDLPPVISPSPKKKFGGGRVIATILGLFLLIGGVGAGIMLTQQQQLFQPKADNNGMSPSQVGIRCTEIKNAGTLGASMQEWGEACGVDKERPIKCLENVIEIYNKNWNKMSQSQLENLGAGNTIYLAVPTKYPYGGTTYGIQGGKFFVNGKWGDETNKKSPDGNFYYDEYTIPANRELFNIFAEVKVGGQWIGFNDLISFCQINFRISPSAQCKNVKAYSETWTLLTNTNLASLKSGNKVNFCVTGGKSSGDFDKARFTINGSLKPASTRTRPGADPQEFCDLYTIPPTGSTFNVTAEIHHTTLGWK